MATETAFQLLVFVSLLGVALGWFALAVVAPGWLSRIRRAWSEWSGILIIGSGLAVVGLGMVCFLEKDEEEGIDRVVRAAYQTAQLFTLNIEADKFSGTVGLLAAASAALFAVLFAFGLISALFSESLDAFRLAVARRHIVVCGVGRNGRRIIADTYKPRSRRLIAAVELEAWKTDDIEMRSRGVIAVVGDATKGAVLRKAGVVRAAEVFVVTGSDEQNIEVALEIASLLEEAGRRTMRGMVGFKQNRTRCFVHIVNRDLAEIFREKTDELEKINPGIDLEVFSAAEAMARSLLETMVFSGRALPAPHQVVHVVLIGFGRFGKSLALHIAEWGHFANRRRLRMTIADQNIHELAKPFLARHPRFCKDGTRGGFGDGSPWSFDARDDEWSCAVDDEGRPGDAEPAPRTIEWVCNARFETLDDICEDRFVGEISSAFADPNVWPAVVVCFDDDHLNFTCAERIREIRDRTLAPGAVRWPIFVRLSNRDELKSLLTHTAQSRFVYAFSSGRGSEDYTDIAESWIERLAQMLHLVYEDDAVKLHVGRVDGAIEDSNRQWNRFKRKAESVWSGVPTAFKPSNRSAAVHGIVKLATLGWKIVAKGDVQESPSVAGVGQMEELAAMEHYRWVSERLLAGWSYGSEPDRSRKKITKKSLDFIPYEDLVVEKQDNDRRVVQTLMAFCRHGEVQLVRGDSPIAQSSGDGSHDG